MWNVKRKKAPHVNKNITIASSCRTCYNLGRNILRLFDVLPNFPFTTCETKRFQIFIELNPSAHSFSQNENFVNTSKKLFKNWNWTFLVVRHFTLALKFVLCILARIVASKSVNRQMYIQQIILNVSRIFLARISVLSKVLHTNFSKVTSKNCHL